MNKIHSAFVLSLSIFLLSGCLNNNAQKVSELSAPVRSEEEAIKEEQESFENIPVFPISTEEVYHAFKDKPGDVQFNKENDTITYLDEHNNLELYTDNLVDESIDQFYTTIYNTEFVKNNSGDSDMASFYGDIFKLIDVPFDEKEFLIILKNADLTKDRKDKTTSYEEDMVITKFESIWLGIEGIYTSDSSKEPAYIEVRVFPENPSTF
ncbi:hypothetical protein HXA31_13280 [Salipaludibacillus agaradhaerens]|uniref:Lipoprotein n=1 Tax=Salipaludibacillus agaradhaerens TaxID=76935 RepID=A0A9Q4AY30_SALAG|nr:hypothetical protein [Salipaludibacillus agaradhaerens]MCR6095107.1 hypothetical protein [Salipaludibacillus agaradhaerens]MCR6115335.1 hypothetical protein [Salipaludibacillus agaradhaerens]